MDDLLRDLLLAVRQLRRQPAFASVVILTLALGIGATTALFGVVHGVLLEPLGFRDEHRLVRVLAVDRAGDDPRTGFCAPDLWFFESRVRSAEALGYWSGQTMTLQESAAVRQLYGQYVSWNLFDLLGVEPVVGRGFAASDVVAGAGNVALISAEAWRQVWSEDSDVIGRTVSLDGEAITILGVLPEGVDFPDPHVELWVPVGEVVEPYGRFSCEERDFGALARLAPGASPDALRAELEPLTTHRAVELPATHDGWGADVRPLRELFVGRAQEPILVAFFAVGLVLLVACSNVAHLMLMRAVGREREMAVRSALGAGRRRLLRQHVVEGLVLAAAGGGVGLLLAMWIHELVLALDPGVLPRRDAIDLDGSVFAFSLVITAGVGLLAGLVPALRGASGSLRDGRRALGGDRRQGRLRLALVSAEVALAVVLVIAAAALAQAVHTLGETDPGFEPEQLYSAHLVLDAGRFGAVDARREHFRAVEQALRAVPGFTSAALGTTPPVPGMGIRIDLPYQLQAASGRGAAVTEAGAPRAGLRVVTPGWLDTVGIPLLHGRDLTAGDREGGDMVALINRALAERLAEDGGAVLGESLRVHFGEVIDLRIVGVVGDTRSAGLDRAPQPAVFVPHAQVPFMGMGIAVRSSLPPATVAREIERAVLAVDPTQPPHAMHSLSVELARVIGVERFIATLLGLFAGVALLLSAIGLYGVFAFWVGERVGEIGLRLALGATSGRVVRGVVGQGLKWTAIGIAPGLLVAVALSDLFAHSFQGVDGISSALLAGAAACLLAVATLACSLPARRAGRIAPTEALRQD